MITWFSVPFVAGKERPRFFKRGRRTGTYTPKKTRVAMVKVATAYKGASIRAHGHVAHAPKGTPVTVAIVTVRPLPKSRPKRILREPDTHKFDADNVAKLILDGLNGVAWDDDMQVCDLRVRKYDRVRGMAERTNVLVMWEDE